MTPWRLLALPPLPLELLSQLFGDPRIEVFVPEERTQQAVEAALPSADLVVADWTPLLRLDSPGPRVAFVQQPSVGYDGTNVEAFAAQGIPVANCAGANAVSVAEWCLSATLSLLRKTVPADAAVRRGEWPQTTLGGRELAGNTVGIIGMGPVGRAAAERFRAMGCPVTYWSRSQKADAPADYLPLADLLATSDIVIVVIALGPETRGLVNASVMKAGALLVNGARGDVVNEGAMVQALRDGQLAGAALDVFSIEPLPLDHVLRELPSVLLSPHMAGSSQQAAGRIFSQTKANLLRVLDGQPVADVVNAAPPLVTRRAI